MLTGSWAGDCPRGHVLIAHICPARDRQPLAARRSGQAPSVLQPLKVAAHKRVLLNGDAFSRSSPHTTLNSPTLAGCSTLDIASHTFHRHREQPSHHNTRSPEE